jgi:hypothetical protein
MISDSQSPEISTPIEMQVEISEVALWMSCCEMPGAGEHFWRVELLLVDFAAYRQGMVNPYESPTVKNQLQQAMPYVWQRPLFCPACGNRSTSVGRACLLHPQFKIRCQSCDIRSRLQFKRSNWIRIQAAWIFAVGIAVALLVLMLTLDPFVKTEQLLRWLTPGLMNRLEANGYQELIPPGIALLLLLGTVIPILLASLFALKVNLRMIAFHSQLVQSDS